MAISSTVKNGGSLVGDKNHPAINLSVASGSPYVKLTDVNTVGEISNISTSATSYIRIDGGTHTKCALTGKILLSVAKKTTRLDCDPSEKN